MGDLKGRSRQGVLLTVGVIVLLFFVEARDRDLIGLLTVGSLVVLTLSTPGTKRRWKAHVAFYGLLALGTLWVIPRVAEHGRGPLIAYGVMIAGGVLLGVLSFPRYLRRERERAVELAAMADAESSAPESSGAES